MLRKEKPSFYIKRNMPQIPLGVTHINKLSVYLAKILGNTFQHQDSAKAREI